MIPWMMFSSLWTPCSQFHVSAWPSSAVAWPLEALWPPLPHPVEVKRKIKRNIKRNMMCRATISAESTQESTTAPLVGWLSVLPPPRWSHCQRSFCSHPGQQQNEHGSIPELRHSEEHKTTVSEQCTTKGPPQDPLVWSDHHPPRKSWF